MNRSKAENACVAVYMSIHVSSLPDVLPQVKQAWLAGQALYSAILASDETMKDHEATDEECSVVGYSDETLDLAELISNMPPLKNDRESINKWARDLANQIAIGED